MSHFTPTPCGLIRGSCNYQPHPESKLYVGLSSSPYYALWCKLYKMNNNLYFNRHHPHRACLQSMLKQYRKVPACGRPQGPFPPPPPVRICPNLTNPPPPSLRTSFMDGPFPRIYRPNYTQQQRSLPKGHFDWGLKSSIDSAMHRRRLSLKGTGARFPFP